MSASVKLGGGGQLDAVPREFGLNSIPVTHSPYGFCNYVTFPHGRTLTCQGLAGIQHTVGVQRGVSFPFPSGLFPCEGRWGVN